MTAMMPWRQKSEKALVDGGGRVVGPGTMERGGGEDGGRGRRHVDLETNAIDGWMGEEISSAIAKRYMC